ncbi:cytochrome b [Paraburkholderia megapolitana]|uniref:cytochrome b n=1 Tax=Paraburkholderia megapolitana TaxID=420953 RepID=UPI0038BB27AD
MFTTPLPANSTQSALSEGKLRYGLPLRALHWLTALCMFVVIPLAWYMTELDRHNPAREGWFNLHKSIGLTVLLLTLIRVFTRLSNAPTPLPESIPSFERTLAHIGHGLLYVILIAMPVSGYLNSYGAGHAVNWFWLFRVPAVVPESHWLAHLSGQIHALLAWATYALIVGHILAVLYHQLIQRVDLLARMTLSTGVTRR